MSLRPLRAALPVLARLAPFALPLLLAAPAQAQTASVLVTIANPMSLARTDANGNGVTKRQLLTPEGINLQDCRDNQSVQFPLTVTGFSTSDTFEIWASDQSGADCAVATARSGATQTCYKVEATFSRTQTQTVALPVKQIIKGLSGNTLDADGCRRVNAYTISVYFLVLRGTDVAGSAKQALLVDTQGPVALSNVRVLPGDRAITISWDAVGEGGADDVTGARAFCDPSPRPAGATDGGSTTTCTLADGAVASVDASDDASLIDAGATCNTVANPAGASGSPIPSAGGIPSDGTGCKTASFAPTSGTTLVPDSVLSAKYGCGSISGSTGSSIRIDSIAGATPVNGQVYAIAVAATDSFGNIGDLSSPICQFPESTSDFWRDYRNAGGQSGGGCAIIESPEVPVGSCALLLVGGVFVMSTMRRARRAQARRNVR
jgi:hypothetical protein